MRRRRRGGSEAGGALASGCQPLRPIPAVMVQPTGTPRSARSRAGSALRTKGRTAPVLAEQLQQPGGGWQGRPQQRGVPADCLQHG